MRIWLRRLPIFSLWCQRCWMLSVVIDYRHCAGIVHVSYGVKANTAHGVRQTLFCRLFAMPESVREMHLLAISSNKKRLQNMRLAETILDCIKLRFDGLGPKIQLLPVQIIRFGS